MSYAGEPKRAPGILELCRRLVVAFVTVIACVVIAAPAREGASRLSTTLLAVASASAHAERVASSSGALHRADEGATPPTADLEAIESDDDEDDPLRDVLAVVGRPAPSAPILREHERERGRERSNDTSRFAGGTGLPRGPPV